MMYRVKHLFLSLILALPVALFIQFRHQVVEEPLLKGYFSREPRPDPEYFTWKRWFSGEFQRVITTRLNEHTGFRNTLVRIRNQYDFSMYGMVNAAGFLEGRDGYLFEEDYIHEYTGEYFIGEKAIGRTLSRLKNVSDSLAARHVPLIIVYEPGKASFFPEYIPRRFHHETRSISNYDCFTKRSAVLGLNFLDLNRLFLQMKDTSRYPLFPRYGMHWSLFGAGIAANLLSEHIERVAGRAMPTFTPRCLVPVACSPGTDYDIGDLMNLACPLPSAPGVYPVVPFGAMPAGTLSALIVADSYYVNLVESYGTKMFGKQDYWYYNSSVYPHQNDIPPVRIDKSDLREKLKHYNVVLLMVSEINLHCCFWNFADEAYQAFHPGEADTHLERIANTIRIDREWFRFMVKKSKEQRRPLEEVIAGDAEYTFLSNFTSLPDKKRMDSIHYIRLNIRQNPEWMANVTRKAGELRIPVDSMMLLDAIYSYDQSKKNH